MNISFLQLKIFIASLWIRLDLAIILRLVGRVFLTINTPLACSSVATRDEEELHTEQVVTLSLLEVGGVHVVMVDDSPQKSVDKDEARAQVKAQIDAFAIVEAREEALEKRQWSLRGKYLELPTKEEVERAFKERVVQDSRFEYGQASFENTKILLKYMSSRSSGLQNMATDARADDILSNNTRKWYIVSSSVCLSLRILDRQSS
ncbi:hypothetical protein ACLOJK_023503 [Asimina triloba]